MSIFLPSNYRIQDENNLKIGSVGKNRNEFDIDRRILSIFMLPKSIKSGIQSINM